MGNLGTGLVHSAFNALAKGVDSIKVDNALSEIYVTKDTLDSLITGWKGTFWEIYDKYIEAVNINIAIGQDKLENRGQLMETRDDVLNQYKNFQKCGIDRQDRQYIEKIKGFIFNDPFVEQFWYDVIDYYNSDKETCQSVMDYIDNIYDVDSGFANKIHAQITLKYVSKNKDEILNRLSLRIWKN